MEVYFYDIAIGTNPAWDKYIYTYASADNLAPNTIVVVPFGSVKKVGFVLKKVKKPIFETKQITKSLPHNLSLETTEFMRWVHAYYPGNYGALVQLFLPSYLATPLPELPVMADSSVVNQNINHTKLTELQDSSVSKITSLPNPTVLYGITGSGKTRVYIEIAKQQILSGKNVLLLYPEISLARQLERNFSEYFSTSHIHIYHSKQTITQQKKSWIAAASGLHGQIFMGPRSALFLPLQNIGLIIIDEAHDTAYKQDSGIRYNGLLVAAQLARLHRAKLVLGSATPPLQETYQVLQKGGSIVEMNELAINEQSEKKFTVVDMRDKNNRAGRTNLLSKQLVENIEKSLDSNKQSLIFINRKGTARMLLCEQCGWHAECEQCEMPLVYHHDSHATQCSVCGAKSPSVHVCPKCSGELSQKSHGIKAIEQELHTLFPHAKIARYDGDSKKSESVQENYSAIRKGEIDILLGTQILTKGLDLPLLETVGILQAENALHLPDYSSEERTFQQLVQVSGRVGRGHSATANIIIQSYDPTNKLFDYIKSGDWPGFYNYELSQREAHLFPPYTFMLKVWISHKNPEKAEAACSKLLKNIDLKSIKVLGPAPSFYQKKAGKFYWQIIFKSSSRKRLAQLTAELPREFMYDLDPISLL